MFTNHLKSVMNVLWTSCPNLLMNLLIIPMSVFFFGDINCDMFKDNILCDLCDIYDMKNIVTGPTCFKGETLTLLDVFLTNKPNSFCWSINIDTGISDFHYLTGIISRAHAPKCGNAWSNIDPWNTLMLKNTREIWILSLFTYVIFLTMWMILYGPTNSLWRRQLIPMHHWSSGASRTIKFHSWMQHFGRRSTRGTCGVPGPLGTSGILPLGENIFSGATKLWNWWSPP